MVFEAYTNAEYTEERKLVGLIKLRQTMPEVLRFLEEEYHFALDTLANAVDQASLYRAQGRVKMMEHLLETIEKADRKVGAGRNLR